VTWPEPSQTFCWQSPDICPALTGVPTSVKLMPQKPSVQVAGEHSTSSPAGHSLGLKHSTHWPAPSHLVPLFCAHDAPRASGSCEATPAVQVGAMHVLLVAAGLSLLSMTETMSPFPLHSERWQSPGFGAVTTTPALTFVKPQTPPGMQMRTWQALPAGQFSLATQPTHRPAPSHI